MEAPTTDKRHEYYKTIHDQSYANLIQYAEMEPEQLSDDYCENAVHAMKHILKYGSCHDVAVGIRCFINFIQSKNILAE